MRIIFIASGGIEWGSARMRCYWPARYMTDAHVITWDEYREERALPVADVYIWQKNVDVSAVEQVDALHIWDVCDPLHWFSPEAVKRYVDKVDGIVTSNRGLADDLAKWSKRDDIRVIPDRLELSHFDKQREHADRWPVRFIWFGISANRGVLFGAWAILARLQAMGYDVSLTIMDEMINGALNYGKDLPVYHVRWELDHEVGILASHDIALLPPYPGPWGLVKSNNKALTAGACGLPVISHLTWHDGIRRLVESAATRQKAGESRRRQVKDLWSVEKSAAEWGQYLCEF